MGKRDVGQTMIDEALTDVTRGRGGLASGTRSPATSATAILAIGSAFVALVIGLVVERLVTSVVRPSAGELTWISDLIFAFGFGFVLYFWLNLRAERAALLDVERNSIVLGTQLAVAATIQPGLLPPPPASRHGFSWAVRLAAAGRIGGDYYDFIDLGGASQIFIIADISGKGMPASMMLMHVRAVFREAVRSSHEPSEIVGCLAQAVHANTGGTPYLTCIVVRLDERSKRVTMTERRSSSSHADGLHVTSVGDWRPAGWAVLEPWVRSGSG